MLLVTLGRRFVSFCGRMHDASFGGEKHGKRRAARWQSRRVERERERGKGGTLCPNHAIVWRLMVDVPPAARVGNDGKDENHRR